MTTEFEGYEELLRQFFDTTTFVGSVPGEETVELLQREIESDDVSDD